MDAKSFILGVACGVFVFAAAGWLLDDNNENKVTNVREAATDSAVSPTAEPPDSTVPINQQTPEPTNQIAPEPLIAHNSNSDSVSHWPENLRERLAVEPKDESWAYYMEQALLHYLGSHSSAAQFDISSIECRSTTCQIEVIGYDESTGPVWQQVMYDIRQQPWSEFGQYGTSWGMIDERFVIVATLHKVPEEN